MATKKDRCLHIDDIVQAVNKRIEETTIEYWLYAMKQAISAEIYAYWYSEMEKSYHRNEGKGYVYVGDAHAITRNPNPTAIEKQVKQVLAKLKEQRNVEL